MTEVINLNRCKDWGKEGDIRCDRKTKWGNPFIMYYEKDRDLVCDLYKYYLDEITKPGNVQTVFKILKIGGLTEYQANKWIEITGGHLDINELKTAKRLGCHCFPLRCHCDYLKQLLEMTK